MISEPIAVVGRGCVLPDALSPEAFWRNVLDRRVSLAPAPRDRWRLPPGTDTAGLGVPDHVFSGIGGFVRGFEAAFDPTGYALPPEEILRLDPLFQWPLYTGRQALAEAGHPAAPPRTGLVLGNLSYPSTAAVRHTEQVWLSAQEPTVRDALLASSPSPRPHAHNRFSSGLPALLTARALGLDGGAYALDAACATSLYAVKLACDRLQDGSADLMLAGAVNRADALFVHGGFALMGAISPTGRSRPFHRDADGLVPGEGAVVLALMRLSDARAQGRRVFAVVRGVGLGNDGRAAGLMVPDAAGQERAMRAAYVSAGVSPESVGLLECHATGTTVGDAVEVRSASRVFAAHRALPAGSVKANVGHLLTTSGAAALLKVIGALDAGVRPAPPHDGTPTTLERPLRLLTEHEDWSGPRRAAVSAFGFGGTNAHLVLDAGDAHVPPPSSPALRPTDPPLAVVALAVRTGRDGGTDEFVAALCSGRPHREPREHVELALEGLRFPPLDLREALPQQLLVLDAAREVAKEVTLPPARTAVVVGAGVDPQVGRHVARRRIDGLWQRAGLPRPPGPPTGLRDAVAPPGTAAAALGTMMNIVANRINSQLDLTGPGFTVSAEEDSGTAALALAARFLRSHEMDAVLVGATDLAHDPVHQAALRDLGVARESGDAAVVLVLKRLPDAERAGERVLAVLDEDGARDDPPDLRVSTVPLDGAPDGLDNSSLFGTPHAAAGLLAVATAVTALRHDIRPRPGRFAEAGTRLRTAEVVVPVLEGPERHVRLRAAPTTATATAARRDGQVAFVYTNGSAAYPHMGRELTDALPDLAEAVRQRCDSGDAPWPPPDFADTGVLGRIWAATRLAALHTLITRYALGLRPDAAIGYSSGETSALVALEAWPDAAALAEDARGGGLFTHDVTGEYRAIRRYWRARGITGRRWRNYLVTAPAERVREAVADQPAVHLMAVNAPGVCVVGGEESACAALVRDRFPHAAVRLDYDIAAHVPELAEVREDWYRLHRRRTVPVPGVRFYRGDTAESYLPTEESAADSITGGATRTIDFPAVIERAYADGVRVFVEHGPGSLCTDWITRILAGRPHLAVALDEPGGRALRRLRQSVEKLAAAGLCDPLLLSRLLDKADTDTSRTRRVLRVPAHSPAVRLPVPDRLATVMAPAPALPTTLPVSPTHERPTVVPAARPPEPPLTGRTAAIARHRDRVTALHRQYLTEQTALHLRYLRGERTMRDALPRVPSLRLPEQSPFARQPALPGPKFDRAQLERLADGPVSELFGPLFAAQDGHHRQTRLPGPPLLLVDRVTGIDAEPASMGTGTIWTETDLRPDAWYLDHTGHIPAGLLVEAGQADLLLISWLGVDLLNRGERVYRLLGCEATYHGGAPRVGQTLRYEIHIDGHAEHRGTRLFFFRYDCFAGDEPVVSIANAQAGFFTDAELAAAGGIRWTPGEALSHDLPFDPVTPPPTATRFDAEAVRAFAEGRPYDCFGPAWNTTRAHVRTPRIDSGRLLLIDEVTAFEPAGGALGRGYLRAETWLRPDGWYFDGHFKNDPVLAGSLMSHGVHQAMAFHLAALGLTIDRDAACFEPVPGVTAVSRCRSQATPDSRHVVYEIHVGGLSAGPEPVLYAEAMVAVDGVNAFHCRNLALRLVRDAPLDHWRELGPRREQTTGAPLELRSLGGLVGHREPRPVATENGFAFGYPSLLACAWGRPGQAFGPDAAVLDRAETTIHLPGPPYHFMSRIVSLEAPASEPRAGSAVVAEYDVPPEVWYFEQNGTAVMPWAVLMEVALQPCGWLAVRTADPAIATGPRLVFRNLDGTARLRRQVRPGVRTLRTRVELTGSARHGNITIVSFTIDCTADGAPLLSATSSFGFFPGSALDRQVGIPADAEESARWAAPCDLGADLTAERPAGGARLPGPMLRMLDRVTGHWPDGGPAGPARLRAEKPVDPGAWYFKAHFFRDPVQPGSLGVEAMAQLLQYHLLSTTPGQETAAGTLEPLTDAEFTWRYRGQVVPTDGLVTVGVDVVDDRRDERGRTARADGWLWVDGRRIYRVRGLGMRLGRT
ncbi:beta-ketoacyl synthase N-terminal-like domain-containing protein [Streptomyces hesseae]|uniref:Beta-ketoacyl synthase N-terminal-like domain-containing protein n=1 Tax=Streptomyces hesseae TaxID=3075519 RepID=A0ABU2SFY6_9ACTN|nr:beta-ketoacyl synthase N-terminal-like domain-containing protein [Streptomyces sp. DSM 40473]MDT0447865.1 beta-ketoacyl synthase N-terminal-like domain-containing protein [Streptomyces sp. DSM 40473]